MKRRYFIPKPGNDDIKYCFTKGDRLMIVWNDRSRSPRFCDHWKPEVFDKNPDIFRILEVAEEELALYL